MDRDSEQSSVDVKMELRLQQILDCSRVRDTKAIGISNHERVDGGILGTNIVNEVTHCLLVLQREHSSAHRRKGQSNIENIITGIDGNRSRLLLGCTDEKITSITSYACVNHNEQIEKYMISRISSSTRFGCMARWRVGIAGFKAETYLLQRQCYRTL
jgi:hypothetical protein